MATATKKARTTAAITGSARLDRRAADGSSLETPDVVRRDREVADMKTTFPMESRTSPAPGIIPEPLLVHEQPAASTHRGGRRAARTNTRLAARRTPLARLMAALRGDKYMVDAYPPAVPPTKRG
jgi:hypothetical protein